MMTYKGYSGHVAYDDEAEIFHGEVLGIQDVVTFQGKSVEELRHAFEDSVEDYLQMCKERGEEPDKPFSGRFLVRMDAHLHKRCWLKAKEQGKSLNGWVVEVLGVACMGGLQKVTKVAGPDGGTPDVDITHVFQIENLLRSMVLPDGLRDFTEKMQTLAEKLEKSLQQAKKATRKARSVRKARAASAR